MYEEESLHRLRVQEGMEAETEESQVKVHSGYKHFHADLPAQPDALASSRMQHVIQPALPLCNAGGQPFCAPQLGHQLNKVGLGLDFVSLPPFTRLSRHGFTPALVPGLRAAGFILYLLLCGPLQVGLGQ